VAIVALLAACGRGAPNLVLEHGQQDLGEVINGEMRMLEVPVRNDGDGRLVIDAVSTSCGCTTAKVDPTSLGPGERGILHITFDSGAHGSEANGPVMRQIYIASNDPDQPEAVFEFVATVVPADF
jgi:hypothetical protein